MKQFLPNPLADHDGVARVLGLFLVRRLFLARRLSTVLMLAICAYACGERSSAPSSTEADAADGGEDRPDAPGSSPRERCDDGADNDGDQLRDCADPDCSTHSACTSPPDMCKVGVGSDAPVACDQSSPPGSFEPDVQWAWMGEGTERYVIVTPLVANLTDDDENGSIDLCDTPDVVVVASARIDGGGSSHLYVLDGKTGQLKLRFDTPVDGTVTPAIGDIDHDGQPEIVTYLAKFDPTMVAFEHDGTEKWRSEASWKSVRSKAPYSGAIALADMDNDGDVEIVAGNALVDHEGNYLWQATEVSGNWPATTIADLDGDGDLEMVLGHAAYHHDGSPLFVSDVEPGYPQVADLDMDGLPEVLVTNAEGLALLEHDGTVRYQAKRPTGVEPWSDVAWTRPATIHDFDGDMQPEYAVSSGQFYTVYEADGSIVWSAKVFDQSGIAAGTAFDFLGDGIAEAMYADEEELFIFDGEGKVLLSTPRGSGTLSEYPVVADIDNDGSAEILVVSNEGPRQVTPSPTVQAIRDKEDRWIQARRIWNQHTYHVTNVREDGTIPQHEQPSWKHLNTFRTNAQIESNIVCKPILR